MLYYAFSLAGATTHLEMDDRCDYPPVIVPHAALFPNRPLSVSLFLAFAHYNGLINPGLEGEARMKLIVVIILFVPCALCFAVELPGVIRCVTTDNTILLKEIGANSCLVWGIPNEAKWRELTSQGIFVFLNGLERPPKEFFEWEGKKRVGMKIPYCYSGEWGKWWVEHVERGAQQKFPAIVNVVPDEFAWCNGHVPYTFNLRLPVGSVFYCSCAECRKRCGTLPELTASRFLKDTPEARRYLQYRYETTVAVIRESLDRARRADPSFLSYYTMNLREVNALERYPYGIALDTLPSPDLMIATAFQTSVDRRGDETRFYHAETVKYLLAARPKEGALAVLAATLYDYTKNYEWTEAYRWRDEVEALLPEPVVKTVRKEMAPYELDKASVILPAVSCIAHGARGVAFFGDEKKEALRELFTFLGRIEPELFGSRVPGKVVVICSRVSEDAWMLRHAPETDSRGDFSDAMMLSGCWAQPANRLAWEFNKSQLHSLGFRSTKAVVHSLMRSGIPFRLHFLENLRTSDLDEADVVVMPFCTHVSEEKARILREYAGRGKLIAFGHRGEYDENGTRLQEPVLNGRRAVFFREEACEMLSSPRAARRLADAVGRPFDVRVRGGGPELEAAWLELKDGGRALFLINWGAEREKISFDFTRAGSVTAHDVSGGQETLATGRGALEIPARTAKAVIFRPQGR